MADQTRRFGGIGVSESDPSSAQHLGYGIQHGIPTAAAANFFEHEESGAYFGELEEALMQGVVGIGSDGDRKTARPPTLDIFPSWPMRLINHHTPPPPQLSDCRSADSTDSGSAQNTTATTVSVSPHQLQPPPPPDLDSPVSFKPSASSQPKQQIEMATRTTAAAAAQQPRAQEKQRRSADKAMDPKTLRRLAQNREAARKSRLRKKAYVQQLESSRIKLTQLEQDLQRARSQGVFVGGAGGNLSSGAAIFDMEYGRWLDEEQKHMSELRGALQAHLPDGDLRVIVDECITHHDEMFRLKGIAAKADVFHLITGMWTTPAERCFLWMGGFRPSEMLKIVMPQVDPLTEQQLVGIYGLQQSSQQAEEALSQGLEQLQHSLADAVAGGSLSESGVDVGDYMGQMAIALGKLSNLEGFVRQADNLRQQTLHQMRRILTVRQAARCFLAIGEYHSRLRAVSSLWSSRPRENTMAEESMCPTTTDNMQMVHHPTHNHFSTF